MYCLTCSRILGLDNKNMRTIILILILVAIAACNHKNKGTSDPRDNAPTSLDSFVVDTSRIALIPLDTTSIWLFEDAEPSMLDQIELLQIEKILVYCIRYFNTMQKKRIDEISAENSGDELRLTDFTIDLNAYKRQYVSAIDKNGEKVVWVNCFCGKWSESGKYNIILVEDGRNCFFNLIINLATNMYYDFYVNGDA